MVSVGCALDMVAADRRVYDRRAQCLDGIVPRSREDRGVLHVGDEYVIACASIECRLAYAGEVHMVVSSARVDDHVAWLGRVALDGVVACSRLDDHQTVMFGEDHDVIVAIASDDVQGIMFVHLYVVPGAGRCQMHAVQTAPDAHLHTRLLRGTAQYRAFGGRRGGHDLQEQICVVVGQGVDFVQGVRGGALEHLFRDLHVRSEGWICPEHFRIDIAGVVVFKAILRRGAGSCPEAGNCIACAHDH